MSGSEFISTASAAARAAKHALTDDPENIRTLQILASDTDEMRQAAVLMARRLAAKQAMLLKVFKPLGRFLGIARDYFETDFGPDLAQKLAGTPDAFLTTPPASIAVPAMEGLSYSIDEPNLKDLYLNLLAMATDSRTQGDAHPSFAEIIRQLSAAEAPHLLDVLRWRVLPIVRLGRRTQESRGVTAAANHVLEFYDDETREPAEEPSLVMWVDNWIRLGLVDVDYSRALVDESRYAWIEDSPVMARLIKVDDRGRSSLRVENGLLQATDFGLRFLAAVSFDGVPIDLKCVDGPTDSSDGS